MKKNIFLICAIVLLTSTVFSQNIDLGFGATAGTKMKFGDTGTTTGFGINARAVVGLNKFGVSAGVSYFLPSTFDLAGSEIKTSYLAINADLHYYFFSIPKVKFYCLGGLSNMTFMNKVTTGGTSVKTNSSDIVIEIGTGLKAGPLFVEAKYQTKVKQFVATVGYNFL